jgi:thymidylate synthase
MKQYHDYLKDIIRNGTRQANRTGVEAITIPGAMMKFDMAEGFPLVTTKKMPCVSIIGETIGHLQGLSNAADFRQLGSKVWDANANENEAWLANPHRNGHDDLGRIYGVQWRGWRDETGFETDQVLMALSMIRLDPTNRRIIINGWNPGELDQMALPPCHLLYQFLVNVEKGELNLCMYQRSCDSFLGVPFNIAMAATMLHLFAAMTGLRPRHFTHFLADAHIYVNHVDQVKELLTRTPLALPSMVVTPPGLGIMSDEAVIAGLLPSHFAIHNYHCHPAIKAPMAV